MTLSVNALRENLERAEQAIWALVGELGIDAAVVRPLTGSLDFVLATTLTRLLDDGTLLRVSDDDEFLLSPAGWLRLEERYVDPAILDQRCLAMRRVLSNIVTDNGRVWDRPITPGQVARNAGLPEGWVSNALISQLLAKRYPDAECEIRVSTSDDGTDFRVKNNFGHPKF